MARRLAASFAALLLAGCAAGSTSAPGASTAPSASAPARPSSPATPLTSATPTPAPASTPDPAYVAGLHQRAQEELTRWSAALKAAGDGALVLIGQLTGQVGQPAEAIAGDFKDALMCGLVEPAFTLPAAAPPDGVVHWPDGRTRTMGLISAHQAVADIRTAIRPEGCDRRPLRLTDARLGTAEVMTSRGSATAPAWEFGVQGTDALVTRVAVADRVRLEPLEPNGMPALDSARLSADGRELTVTFVGTPGTGDQLCGLDYTAEAIESELAVVVIVLGHSHPPSPAPPSPAPPSGQPYVCTLEGAERMASVVLASPLGQRTLLEVTQGTPVPVLSAAS